MEENKEIEKRIKKDIIIEMIIDKLFNSLEYVKVNENIGKLKIDNYEIDSKEMTYLLSKYDEERFKQEFIMKEKIYKGE